jgi:glucose-6-phosphate isomerase
MLKPFHLSASEAHQRLQELAKVDGQRAVTEFFSEDPNRFHSMHAETAGLLMDWSKQRISKSTMKALHELASEADWQKGRKALFSGDPINQTEGRAVLHMAMRAEAGDSFNVNGLDVMPDVLEVREKMLAFADEVRSQPAIRNVVNIGIGGSDLGPLMVTKALRRFHDGGPAIHFVSNVDGAHLDAVLDGLDPRTTMFVVVSKTFTTQETMANAMAAKDWLIASLGEEAVKSHFAAVSTNMEAAGKFGIVSDRIFGFSDWVGGRYSLWGPVGLSIACGIGSVHFRSLLKGARAMDVHFQEAPDEQNLPLISALIGIWSREYLGFETQVVLPYAQDLDRLPAYLQQADMESNGKSTGRDGEPVAHHTGAVVWGEAGTNGQHAFYQLLHQGTSIHPADIIAVKSPMSPHLGHHEKLLANAIAQAEALMVGKSKGQVVREMKVDGATPDEIDAISPHRVFKGNRPSTFFLLDELDPETVGQLIAFYEHRIFVQGLIWNICSYDQWGVELGKVLAKQILSEWSDEAKGKHDPSTDALMKKCQMHR